VDEDTYPEGRQVEKTIESAMHQDPHLNYAKVSVHATQTEITLTGTVLTQTAKDTAERIAQENAGGRKVNNKLRVNPNTNPGPGE
jgi:osmotically-inducible protein OsmY